MHENGEDHTIRNNINTLQLQNIGESPFAKPQSQFKNGFVSGSKKQNMNAVDDALSYDDSFDNSFKKH